MPRFSYVNNVAFICAHLEVTYHTHLQHRIHIGCNGNHFVLGMPPQMLNVTYVTVSEELNHVYAGSLSK